MKKLLFLLAMMIAVGSGINAQQQPKEEKAKIKKTSTVPQKVHNAFSKNKKYKGYKVKHKVETKKP